MSIEALNWAFDSGLKPGPRFVLVILGNAGADHSGEDWSCFPSVQKIMSKTGFSRAAVERHLKDLEAAGWVSRKRRRRPDGKLGIYDYVLHRDPGDRDRLKGERGHGDIVNIEGEEPHVNLTYGPCVNLDGAMPQIDESHASNCGIKNPKDNPNRTLTPGAREAGEPGSKGFEAALAAYPASGQERTLDGPARAAWAMACQEFGQHVLLAAIRLYVAEDTSLRTGDFGAPGFHKWLAEGRWRVWVERVQAGTSKPASGEPWPGPDDVRDAIVQKLMDNRKVVSALNPAGWDEATRTIIPRSTWAREALAAAVPAGVQLGPVARAG